MLASRTIVAIFALLLILPKVAFAQVTTSGEGQVGAEWRDVGIGSPVPAGSHAWANSTLGMTGAGAGLNVKGSDQFQYRYLTRAAGDFEFITHLVGFTGQGDATAGIMARADNAATSHMTALYFKAKGNALSWMSRIPGESPVSTTRMFSSGIQLAQPPPLWMKMVRVGSNFAVYKSRDGKLWSMISNVSGGPIAIDGPVELGFFVTADADGKPVTATFDSIDISAPHLAYETSWVGNTYGCRNDDQHVSNALSAMWVAPDGTCYTSSYWDEGGRPVTSYRNGKVARSLPIGTPQTSEGCITGDDSHIFVAAVDHITELDPSASDFAPTQLTLSVNLLNKKAGLSVVSGLASNGHELFVADSRDNLIRVVTLDPVPTYQSAEAANDRIEAAPAPVTVPDNDPRFAPAVLYQTRRCGEGVRYTIPGLIPGATYTVRAHLAAYADKEPPQGMGKDNEIINVRDLAGGALKAAVKDFTGNKADANGHVAFTFGGYGGALCGLEVLDQKGARVFAINCGGPAVGDFKGESPELGSRDFAFDRPGPMSIDRRGDLWIIQRGNDYPIGGGVSAKYKAAVRCFRADGTFTGREITDVVNPRALGYDATSDQLLVGENGPDLNVRFYTSLDKAPVLARTFGQKGGIYGGPHPGLIDDPASGGYARFAGISGVGVDKAGNLYVGGGFGGTDLREFTPAGKFGWMLNSNMFCNTYDVDPASDGAEIYGTFNHLHLDLTKTSPGTEQKYVSYNWDLGKFGDPERQGGSQSIVRRLGPGKRLVMYTSGQGIVGDIDIYRYEGEIAIPAARIDDNGSTVWIDANGDGKVDPDEVTKMASSIGWITSLSVDAKGDIWAGNPGTGGSFMRHFTFKGFNAKGAPIYSGVKGEGYEDIPFPEEGGKTNAWAMACKMDYDSARDIMVCFFPAVARTGEADKSAPQYFLARYDNWSKGNRTSKWKVKALSPYTDPDYFMYEVNFYPYSGYEGMEVAGNYIFMAYVFGEIQAFNLNTGKLVQMFAMGPEVDGGSAWEDAAMGLRAYERKNGEYLIFDENSGWGGKNNFIRWKP